MNRDGTVCISDIEKITSAIFYIISEKDDILAKNQISDRVNLITKVYSSILAMIIKQLSFLQRFGLQSRQDKITLEDWKDICCHDDNFSKTLTNWL